MSAQVWRVVDTRGVTREMTAELLIAATEHTSARWRFTHNSGEVTYDVDADDDTAPREALCRWAAFRFTEIRGPGELTTAEQLAAAETRVAELTAALRELAPTCDECTRLATYENDIGLNMSCDECRTTSRSRRKIIWYELRDAALRRSLDAVPEQGR